MRTFWIYILRVFLLLSGSYGVFIAGGGTWGWAWVGIGWSALFMIMSVLEDVYQDRSMHKRAGRTRTGQ